MQNISCCNFYCFCVFERIFLQKSQLLLYQTYLYIRSEKMNGCCNRNEKITPPDSF